METLKDLPNNSILKDSNGLSYREFRKKLKPNFYKVWTDIMLCLAMMFAPILFFAVTANYNLLTYICIPVCALWSAYWIHAYSCFFHEAAHFNVHKNRKKNDIISNIMFIPFIGMLIKDYRLSHWQHHKHLGTDNDTEISYLSALSTTNLLQVVTGLYHLKIVLKYVKNFKSIAPQSRKNLSSKIFLLTLLITIIIQLILGYLMFMYVSFAAGLSWIIAFFLLYPLLAKIRQTLEHRASDVTRSNNSDECRAVNRIFGTDFISRYFGAAGFNRHLLHHYDPSISYTKFNELENFLKDTQVADELNANRKTYTRTLLNLLEL